MRRGPLGGSGAGFACSCSVGIKAAGWPVSVLKPAHLWQGAEGADIGLQQDSRERLAQDLPAGGNRRGSVGRGIDGLPGRIGPAGG